MSHATDTITVYSDYVCPFCYLGRQSVRQYDATRDGDLEIDWHPFDLRSQKRGPDGTIDHSVDDGKDEQYFDQVRENVARLKAEYDANEMLDMDALPEHVDSLNAQLASFYVQTEHPERWSAFHDGIFEALWVDGRDIGDSEVLESLADEVGLDGAEIRSAVTDDGLRDRVREQFAEAHERGVTGVPTFVSDGAVARGAVPPEHIRRLVDDQ